MAAVASATRRIRIGALVTPLPRRRPWVLARQIATLDRLSNGRLVVGVGLGDDAWKEFSSFGEVTDRKLRGEVLDEALELLQRLMSGEPVKFTGEHFTVDATPFLPRPVQEHRHPRLDEHVVPEEETIPAILLGRPCQLDDPLWFSEVLERRQEQTEAHAASVPVH